jgi:hypothetical protein
MRRSSMKARFSAQAFIATVVIFGVSACAQTQQEPMAAPTAKPVSTPAGYEDSFDEWKLGVDGQSITAFLENRADASITLNKVLFGEDSGIRMNDEQLAALLELAENDETTAEELRAALNGSDSLNGLAGFSVRQVLHAYVTGEPQPVRGKIREYSYDRDHRGGYLEVDTEVETLQGGVVHTDEYFWAIGVRPGTYEIVELGNDPAHPFPGTPIQFGPTKAAEIADRRLDQKLWAQGTGIVVLGVWRNGSPLPAGHPWLDSTAASCIDLMFWGFPPKSELPRQRSYCLGRCAHPLVINTE